MTNAKWFTGALLIVQASAAQAHTHLKAAMPAEGSTVKSSPEHIMLTFSEPTRLTALTIQKEGEKEQKLSRLPTEAAAQVMVPAPKLAPGKYVVNWRVVGKDNHVMSGKLHFAVGDSAASGKASHDSH